MSTKPSQGGVSYYATSFNDHLKILLLRQPEYKSDSGELLLAMVRQHALSNNPILIKLLLSDAKVKEAFFTSVEGALVFNHQEFIQVLEMSEYLTSSFTKYTNKIGLTSDEIFLSRSDDVVLTFPYKDAILVGGQEKEDQKRNEVFLHEVIGRDQITNLLAPKVLTNPIRYEGKQRDDKTWEVEKTTASEVLDTDNLIIKGNNLVALATLRDEYWGQVKCIYIDPPYNRDQDSFGYNDRFNHSTWLVFMRNRLSVAKDLLTDDGLVFVHCDDHEQAYLKVLMDEVFGREKFVSNISRVTTKRVKGDKVGINSIHDYILVYAKDINLAKITHPEAEDNEIYNLEDKHVKERGKYLLRPLDNGSIRYGKNLDYVISTESGEKIYAGGDFSAWEKRQQGGAKKKDWCFRWSEAKYNWGVENDMIVIKEDRNGQSRVYFKIYELVDNNLKPSPKLDNILSVLDNCYNNQGTSELKKLELNGSISYPKPESLLKTLLDMATSEADLVMDFFLGSGTTAAVAHKMGRRYIGIEQMDYIQDVTVERLKKVIEGEQGGISKSVGWRGGGSFVYCELMENGIELIKEIAQATSTTINDIKDKVFADDRISGLLSKEELENASGEFDTLSLEEKRKALTTLVDKNKLYVNLHDIDDADYNVSDEVKQFNKSFYSL